jgi:hypothetical protein
MLRERVSKEIYVAGELLDLSNRVARCQSSTNTS